MDYTPDHLRALRDTYRDGLLLDVLPFWTDHCVDHEQGGFVFNLDREGRWIDTDKAVWIQGRFAWLLATLYRTVEARSQWLDLAAHGVAFLERHAFDRDGRMFFQLTRAGQPLRKRRYIFSEAFATIAFAAYAAASGDDARAQRARDLFRNMIELIQTPGRLEPKVNPQTRPQKGLAVPMILIATAQVLRDTLDDPLARTWIDRSIEEIACDFMKPAWQAVLETVGPQGEFIDSFDGRLLNPGHAIEAGWFVLHEARVRGGDAQLRDLGLQIVDWSWQWGWDSEYGGMTYFRDVRHLPPTEYWHDMKFWWPQCEAIIAQLLAWHLTGDPRYAARHQMAHDWAHAHFPDPEHGEWYGYLHRDGRISTTLKGNLWKGPFHIPRMQWYCWQLLDEVLARPR